MLALVDTGSTLSYISVHGVRDLQNLHLAKTWIPSEKVIVANGSAETVNFTYDLPLEIQDHRFLLSVRYLPCLTGKLLLGLDAIQYLGLRMNGGDQTWHFPNSEESHPFESRIVDAAATTSSCGGLLTLSTSEKNLLDELLGKFQRMPLPPNSVTDLVKHHIDVQGHQPIRQKPYPVNPKLQEVIHKEVDKMLADGVIRKSSSGWSNPIVLVRKPDNTYRFCLDFRKLNNVTKKDAYPLPNMTSILDQLRSARYISKLDLTSAYWSIALDDDSCEKTAFAVPGRGLFEFVRMPFGLTNATASFQRLMDSLIGPELEPNVYSYLDDVIVVSDTIEQHLRLLETVLDRLHRSKLRINWAKCEFCMSEVTYLGFKVDKTGLKIDPEKLRPVIEYPAPRNLKELRRFLGMCSWYRRFIPDFAETTASLTKLLRKQQKWEWTEAQDQSFEALKQLLVSPPILSRPDFQHPFCVQTDASHSGLGAVLTQTIEGKEHVIAYASRSLSKAELNYTVTEKECLAVVFGCKKFRPYIEGYKVTVITDHSSLRWLHSLTNPTPRLARWALELQSHDLEIIHRKGALNHVPDALSRIPSCSSGESFPVCALNISDSEEDSWYSRKLLAVTEHPERHPDYQVVDNRLYRRRFDSLDLVLQGATEPWKLVIPDQQIPDVLREVHDDAAHFGVEKTYARLTKHYYFPGMWNKVNDYVRTCKACQEVKSPPLKPPGLMNSHPSDGPWQRVYMDLMGPYPRSSRNNVYILVIEDQFTKWVELTALRVASAQVVMEQFKKLVLHRYGAPSVVFTDNGTPFVNNLMSQLLRDLNIQHMRTPPYFPQSNLVERKNRDLKRLIRTYTDARQRNWDVHLSEFAFAINTTVHSSTGYTPALLNFGRELPSSNTVWSRSHPNVDPNNIQDAAPARHVEKLHHLKELYDLVNQNQMQASQRQTRYYNLRRRDVQYNPGDLVMRLNFKLSSAANHYNANLDKKWLGPFVIGRRIGPVIYELLRQDNSDAGRWHVRHLKPFFER
ncbi:hypothetical protein M8J77_014305 [Diaphorina citri]|nr:hypothetical protein M8J77_014305 [Diaphorina citri]